MEWVTIDSIRIAMGDGKGVEDVESVETVEKAESAGWKRRWNR